MTTITRRQSNPYQPVSITIPMSTSTAILKINAFQSFMKLPQNFLLLFAAIESLCDNQYVAKIQVFHILLQKTHPCKCTYMRTERPLCYKFLKLFSKSLVFHIVIHNHVDKLLPMWISQFYAGAAN